MLAATRDFIGVGKTMNPLTETLHHIATKRLFQRQILARTRLRKRAVAAKGSEFVVVSGWRRAR